MKSGIDILIESKSELRWMIADQTVEFDSYFLMPIRNRQNFVDRIVSFMKYRLGVPPETLTKTVNEKLRDVLMQLQESGEDLDRLACWLLSMKNDENKSVPNHFARDAWSDGFYYWRKNGLQEENCKNYRDATEVIDSYVDQVIEPWREFFDKTRISDINWHSGPEKRSEIDNFLHEIWYEGIGSCPVEQFALFYKTVLQRTWFQKISDKYSDAVFEDLYGILAILAYDGKSLSNNDPRHVRLTTMRDAFELNQGYDFWEYCRNW